LPELGDTRQELVDRGLRVETLAAEPLVADWRAAIAACGLKPSTYKSSPEQLARRVLKSGPLHTGLTLVDVYCDVATRHLAPLGGYDVARLPGSLVELRMADPEADEFHPLGGRDGEMPLGPDVAVYAVGSTVICWAYNCRDSRDTCLHEDTDVGVFLGEAVTARQHEPLRAALADLGARLVAAGAEVGPASYADGPSPRVDITP
jgi:DNA/RNA-binding domain of Phe-tRNA-synthetase-like protein